MTFQQRTVYELRCDGCTILIATDYHPKDIPKGWRRGWDAVVQTVKHQCPACVATANAAKLRELGIVR